MGNSASVGSAASSDTKSARRKSSGSSANSKPPDDDVFKELVDTKFSFESAYAKVDSVMRDIRRFKSARSAAVASALNFLATFTSASAYGNDLARMWAKKLNSAGVVKLAMSWWPSFWQPDFLKMITSPNADDVQKGRIVLENFWNLCRIMWNGSDASPELCETLVQSGVIEELVKLMDRADFKPEAMRQDPLRTYTVKAASGVMHNCLRLCHDEAKRHFRLGGGHTILPRYLNSDVPMICTKAAIVLAYGVNEEEIDVINAKDDIIKHIVSRLLAPALGNDKDHRALGFSAEETMLALNALAANDENKLRMVQAGVVPLYLKALQSPSSDGELEAAVKGFWILSFRKEAVQEMRKLKGCKEELEACKLSSEPAVSKAATGALWNMEGRAPQSAGRVRATIVGVVDPKRKKRPGKPGSADDAAPTAAARAAAQKHVMVSYDHQHQPIVRQLNNALKQAGYITWMDVDQMSGSTLEAMAEAIEEACVVIVCMSTRYKDSPSCRTEAEYAYRLRKDVIPVRTEFKYNADGWLGILIGAKLYFDCHSLEQVSDCCKRVVKELGQRGKIGSKIRSNSVDVVQQKNIGHLGAPPSQATAHSGVEAWSPNQVQKWLTEGGLSHLTRKLASFDGALMLELQAMYHKAPSVFYQNVRQDLAILNLPDLLKFTKLLDKLQPQ